MRRTSLTLAFALVAVVGAGPRADAKTITESDTTNQTVDLSTSTTSITIGFRGVVRDVNVRLYGIFHTHPDDLDVTLVHGDRRVRVMSDAGGDVDISGVHLTFDDEAVQDLPGDTQLFTGSYRPADFKDGSLGPPVKRRPRLGRFDGMASNGRWKLVLTDDAATDVGGIDGWDLTVTARR